MADASVRPARPDDAGDLARLQLSTWQQAYRTIMPAPVLQGIDTEQAAATWAAAITAPPTPQHRVLVALEQETPVGFCAIEPDQDGEPSSGSISIMLVEPRFGRRGHGSRLLAAAVEHFRDDQLTRATTWCLIKDPASLAFYRSAGWETDGAARSLDMAGTEVDEVRLHTAL